MGEVRGLINPTGRVKQCPYGNCMLVALPICLYFPNKDYTTIDDTNVV